MHWWYKKSGAKQKATHFKRHSYTFKPLTISDTGSWIMVRRCTHFKTLDYHRSFRIMPWDSQQQLHRSWTGCFGTQVPLHPLTVKPKVHTPCALEPLTKAKGLANNAGVSRTPLSPEGNTPLGPVSQHHIWSLVPLARSRLRSTHHFFLSYSRNHQTQPAHKVPNKSIGYNRMNRWQWRQTKRA